MGLLRQVLPFARAGPQPERMEANAERAMTPAEASPLPQPPEADGETAGIHPHNFDVQKELHQKIRNDPDYDDWEYGTEPLPHEAWLKARPTSEPEPG